ncbi:glucans biosynthesis glucosyltransferase MdoH [Methylobacterium isbiliense]|uniref:Glucans biosynthesis glucosyltransferase H n=1 Tax=Methylobacterium isbiliense TaxID=315478 RepID=A0ABQ4SHJ5_9HYPH|nr:glucans biosynthesis glucosyltransferase MdoH [Methylobacterium isbiliense]MDN3624367.1 glucans biosynthesis glucosyltransferase MdoH [Methylobacterium isbiliense]GJE01358.1 Glucans biosynthesis glucosyltransferase H [Methylobacterium isbiliense]
MLHPDPPAPAGDAPAARAPLTTPTGLQARVTLRRRRILVVLLCLATCAVFAAGLVRVLGAGGWSALDGLILLCCLVALPWTVLGLWNAVIGFLLLRAGPAGVASACPVATAGDTPEPLRLRTAVVMTLRNEQPERALARLRLVVQGLEATGEGAWFSVHVLSDTDDPALAAREEAAMAAWRGAVPGWAARLHYRRRRDNAGFKAGNLQEFCARAEEALMLPLDADSLMSGGAIVRLVRIMQAHPRLGILQGLVVGAPSMSPFARVFQFGMRHGMRPYTIAMAWWTGECGPFWGHNALVRIAPFAAHCRLPALGPGPLGGPILSHDQVEAVLMRRAGYEVRVLPVEEASFEENPPTLLDHLGRDRRWCEGNLQYLRLLGLPDLLPVSRFQLVWAILMFLGAPATVLVLLLLPLKAATAEPDLPVPLAAGLYLAWLGLSLAPRIAGYAEVLARRAAAAYGGTGRFLAGTLIEAVFNILLYGITIVRLSVFMAGLALGRRVAWGGQSRDAAGVSVSAAARALPDVTLFGLGVSAALAAVAPGLLPWLAPLLAGPVLAVPLAMLTASPALGRFMARHRLCASPEEIAPPPEIRALRAGAPPRAADAALAGTVP